ncbi:hypothetical protein L1887_21095 [Cichorium endivia]|nr:hypothetical protein L1887_21095 [Cichorium endivia]
MGKDFFIIVLGNKNGNCYISEEKESHRPSRSIEHVRIIFQQDLVAGIDSSSRLRVRSVGNIGRRGGLPGDLFVIIDVIPNPVLKRDDTNILYTCKVTYLDAILGTPVKVPTVGATNSTHMRSLWFFCTHSNPATNTRGRTRSIHNHELKESPEFLPRVQIL